MRSPFIFGKKTNNAGSPVRGKTGAAAVKRSGYERTA